MTKVVDIPELPVAPDHWNTPRAVALIAAVVHHGLSNLADHSIPPRADTVIDTAAKFEAFLAR